MKPQALIPLGLIALLLGVGILLLTPRHVTWGNHHNLGHWTSQLLIIFGVVALLTGFVRRKQG